MFPWSRKAIKICGKKDIVTCIALCNVVLLAGLFYSIVRRTVKGEKPSTKEDSSTNVFTEELVQGNKSEWKVKHACRKASLRILYFVHTAPKNTEKRRWLRKTIADPKIASVMNSAIVFFVGETSQRDEHEAVLDEAIHEGDVVVLNFTDTYKNLTHKFLLGAKWVSDNCRLDSAVTIVKLDDDVLVNVFALLSYLKSGVMALTGFHCKVVRGAMPFRTQKSKWYVSEKDFPQKVYPPYCAGAAFIMQPTVLFAIYHASRHVPFFWVDDVYVTGVVGEHANITLVDMSESILLGEGKSKPTVKDATVFVHTGWSTSIRTDMEQMWNRFMQYNQTVNHNFNTNVVVYYRSVG
ncbi:beta-1,3-galactosyltransferase 5-like [Dermacentor albipictus]|uniref:beta-1,3-galactosyltransferase 5-like n=1 Tax=Dermacentor albipictus TaxID=60249 RepID=UPI0031FC9E85